MKNVKKKLTTIPVVDIFAGPGGLGEGFAKAGFNIALSIEKDPVACNTLRIRKFFHLISSNKHQGNYFRFLKGEIDLEQLKSKSSDYWNKAEVSVLEAELGNPEHEKKICKAIETVINQSGEFILLGGPPCQAYSIAGRSRSLGVGQTRYVEEKDVKRTREEIKKERAKLFYADKRHHLYLEYIKILANYQPNIFIMENVKGILSAKKGHGSKEGIFEEIIKGLEDPDQISGISRDSSTKKSYELFSLSNEPKVDLIKEVIYNPRDFLVKCEDYGVPQNRHRIIVMGIRSNASFTPNILEKKSQKNSVRNAIGHMPKLRSAVSKTSLEDTFENWASTIENEYKSSLYGKTDDEFNLDDIVRTIVFSNRILSRGARHIKKKRGRPLGSELEEWYLDKRIRGWIQHETRSHMASDLGRYLFCSAFALRHKRSPKINEWQGDLERLKPKHLNVTKDSIGDILTTKGHNDRFKVQTWDKPSSTIVSHISKDGHYYIHPDPLQCRSLTVREAARLQTFPDNYFFSGNRTQQYHQVGNAVPPYLAWQIAKLILNMNKVESD